MLPNPARRLRDAVPLLGKTRRGVVLSGVSGAWLMTYLAFEIEAEDTRNAVLDRLGLGWSLVLAAGATAGLGVCAVALNDVLDRRQDRVMGRAGGGHATAVASGRVSVRTAVAVAMGALLLALFSAGGLGPTSLQLAVLLGAGLLFYNLLGRFLTAVRVVTLGVLHGLALALPNPSAVFVWPVLLTMTHVMACELLRHGIWGKRPRLRGRDVAGVLVGWAFWSLLVLVLMGARRETMGVASGGAIGRWVWVGPTLGVVAFGAVMGVIWRNRARRFLNQTHGPAAGGERFYHLTISWLMIYDIGWLWSLGLWWQGGSVMGLLALAWLPVGVQRQPPEVGPGIYR
ncbi:MAG: hypothetical protein AAGG38_03810 [Planctomycetota bacterium]